MSDFSPLFACHGYGIFSRVGPPSLLVVALEVLALQFDKVWSFLLC